MKKNNDMFTIEMLKKWSEESEMKLMRSLKSEEFDSYENLRNAIAEVAASLNWLGFQIRKIKA